MERDYGDGVKDGVTFFTGTEIEHTPAYGMKTLFVVGVHPSSEIAALASMHRCEHVYLGANQSFALPVSSQDDAYSVLATWETMAKGLLENKLLVTLDFDVRYVENILETCLIEYHNFIPQLSVKIPYARQLGYNACIKIDDRGFKASNEGVWVHQLQDLMDRSRFTDWREYGKDQPI